jgi:hypothetical protein
MSKPKRECEEESDEQTNERVEPLLRVPVAYFRAGRLVKVGTLG